MRLIDPAGPFPLRTYAELVLTCLAFPAAWLVYALSTPWRSLEEAIVPPATIVALWLVSEPVCAFGRSRGWLLRDPLFLRHVLRPCAVGYGLATGLAIVFGIARTLVTLLLAATSARQ